MANVGFEPIYFHNQCRVVLFFLTKSTSDSSLPDLSSMFFANGQLCEFTVTWQIQILVEGPQGWLGSLQISSALGGSESLVQGAGCWKTANHSPVG